MADFDAVKHVLKVESPEVDINKPKREQVKDSIFAYFEMTPSGNLGRLKMSCKTYCQSLLPEKTLLEHSTDSLAARSILEAIQGFIDSSAMNEEGKSVQMRQELFDLYCIAVSKAYEYEDFTYEETLAKISECHEKCFRK